MRTVKKKTIKIGNFVPRFLRLSRSRATELSVGISL